MHRFELHPALVYKVVKLNPWHGRLVIVWAWIGQHRTVAWRLLALRQWQHVLSLAARGRDGTRAESEPQFTWREFAFQSERSKLFGERALRHVIRVICDACVAGIGGQRCVPKQAARERRGSVYGRARGEHVQRFTNLLGWSA